MPFRPQSTAERPEDVPFYGLYFREEARIVGGEKRKKRMLWVRQAPETLGGRDTVIEVAYPSSSEEYYSEPVWITRPSDGSAS